MQLTFHLTEEDYRQAFKAFRARTSFSRWSYRLGHAVLWLTFACALLLTFFGPDRSFKNLLPIWFIWLFWVYFLWLCPWLVARKMIRSNPTARAEHNLDANDAGIRHRSEFSEGNTSWKTYVGWGETDKVFSIFPSGASFFPIPKRAMTREQQEEFRAMLKRHIPGNR